MRYESDCKIYGPSILAKLSLQGPKASKYSLKLDPALASSHDTTRHGAGDASAIGRAWHRNKEGWHRITVADGLKGFKGLLVRTHSSMTSHDLL